MSSDEHDYLSTACYHGLHVRCRLRCKFCDTPCRCECHQPLAPPRQPEPSLIGKKQMS